MSALTTKAGVRRRSQLPTVELDAPVAVKWGLGATGALLALYAVNSVVQFGGGVDKFIDRWVYDLFPIACAAICAFRAFRVRRERTAWLLLATGMTLWAAGSVYYSLELIDLPYRPIPSVSDYLWLSFYPAAYVAIMLLLRARIGRVRLSIWLDGVIAALALGAASASIVFQTVLHSNAHGSTAQVITDLAYPIGDLVLLLLVTIGLACCGWKPGRTLLLLGAGFSAFIVTDSLFLYQVSTNSYTAGTTVDLGWSVGPWLIALAAWQPARRAAGQLSGRTMAGGPILFGIAGLGLLAMMTAVPRNGLAVVMAVASIAAVMARLVLSLIENQQLLAATRKEALTDALTGLPNRRGMIDDLTRALDEVAASSPRTLALFDLDGFKAYNDRFGHPAGDQLLARLATRLRMAVGPCGRGYRLGGDEFCVLLDPGVSSPSRIIEAAAHALAERGAGFTIGSSYGTVTLPTEAASVADVLHVADGRMYEHKGARRTATVVGHPREFVRRAASAQSPDAAAANVATLARRVGRRLGLDRQTLELTLRAGELHDVGKLAIPQSILDKPGALTEQERAFVENHTLIGERILNSTPAFAPVARLVRSTHERFDGTGYPDAIAGEQIPLPARIVSACDALHAMTSSRPYASRMTIEAASAELRRCAGTQLDPEVVGALLAELDEQRAERSAESPPATRAA